MTPQQIEWRFFLPVLAAYCLPALGLLAYVRSSGSIWPAAAPFRPARPWLEFWIAIGAALAVLAMGQAYRAGWLLPTSDTIWGRLAWVLDNLLIFAPLFIVMLWRRQPLSTAWISPGRLWLKLAAGLLCGLLGLAIYLGLRSELDQAGAVLTHALDPAALVNFPAVLLEGVALAFLFVRLRWAVGFWPAALLPAVLFALAHFPGAIADGADWQRLLAFGLFNTGIVVAILALLENVQDVIWLALLHHLMDAAIQAY